MINVDRYSIQKPKFYDSILFVNLQEQLKGIYSKGVRTDTRLKFEKSSEILSEIIPTLLKLFKSKCAYCESPIRGHNFSVDQFRPRLGAKGFREYSKDHYGWLAYIWENQYLICNDCKRFKGQWFPIEGKRVALLTPIHETIKSENNFLVDPCKDKPYEHFFYHQNGWVEEISQKGKITIDLLQLNRPELILKRNKVLLAIKEKYSRIRLHPESRRGIAKAMLPVIKNVFGTSGEAFQGIQRYFLSRWMYPFRAELPNFYRKQIQEWNYRPTIFDITQNKKKIGKKVKLDLSKHVYLDKIHVHNFKCFKDLNIIFPEVESVLQTTDGRSKEPWLVFLGENGVGKSSLLKAIALCLMDKEYRKKIKVTPESILRRGARSGFISLFTKESKLPITLKFSRNGSFEHINPLSVNVVGYGATRVLPLTPSDSERGKIYPVKAKNLFDYRVALSNVKSWMLKLSNTQFAGVKIALKDLLMLDDSARFIRSKKQGEIYVYLDGQRIPLEYLSDGYQTILALAVDMMSMFIKEGSSLDSAEGVALIDEIGTHLHPTWKMAIVTCLRNTFPKIQFIVTTHEPLCLRGLLKGEIVLLTRTTEGIEAFNELPDPSAMRIDQLLTSDFFGLHSTVDPTVEKKFQEYYFLLAKTRLTKNEEKRLVELRNEVPRNERLGDDLREELVYYATDRILAQKKQSEPVATLKTRTVDKFFELWEETKKSRK